MFALSCVSANPAFGCHILINDDDDDEKLTSTRVVVVLVGVQNVERIPGRSSHNILPMEGLTGKITSSLHESNFACYNCCLLYTSDAADE